LQAAREANARFQERFIGILGHDLRNPLTAILMGASALQRYASPATELKVVGRIQSSAERMRRMIEQLLDLTRARHGGGIPVELKSCDVAGVVRRVLDELEMAHPERTLTLDVRGDATGECDGDRLGQVVSNLVGNAIRHGERDGRVDVILEGDGDAVTLTVRNSGAPIAPELLPVMFDPFRRGNASSSGGLGLGLFITQQIVHAHGGTIDVMSSAESGTTFAVRLPRRKPAGDGEMTNGIGAAQPQTPVL
ncbi:MAG: Histidine protein kinase AsgD, partial [bacterium]|nr:Histidine protein kinase AsgD [bacterium]